MIIILSNCGRFQVLFWQKGTKKDALILLNKLISGSVFFVVEFWIFALNLSYVVYLYIYVCVYNFVIFIMIFHKLKLYEVSELKI